MCPARLFGTLCREGMAASGKELYFQNSNVMSEMFQRSKALLQLSVDKLSNCGGSLSWRFGWCHVEPEEAASPSASDGLRNSPLAHRRCSPLSKSSSAGRIRVALTSFTIMPPALLLFFSYPPLLLKGLCPILLRNYNKLPPFYG